MKKITLLFAACASTLLVSALRQESFAQAPRKVILEDFTGTDCGYCPRGKTEMENCIKSYPNLIGITNHSYNTNNPDPMDNAYTKAIDAGLNVGSYPTGCIDRFNFPGVMMSTDKWKAKVASRFATTAPVSVNISRSYNATTRVLNVTVTAAFVAAASGDMRISCVLTEDGIVYPQNNAMNNDPTSPWYQQGVPIVNYVHDHTARKNLASNSWGTSGVIPASVTSGKTYSTSYTYTVPTAWNASKMFIVAFVNKYGTTPLTHEILNANKIVLIGNNMTGITENEDTKNQLEVKQNTPNPFSDHTAIQFQLYTTDHVSVKIYDMYGKEVNRLIDSELIPGEHTFYWMGNDNHGNLVAGGVYYYTISTSSQSLTKPMIFINQ